MAAASRRLAVCGTAIVEEASPLAIEQIPASHSAHWGRTGAVLPISPVWGRCPAGQRGVPRGTSSRQLRLQLFTARNSLLQRQPCYRHAPCPIRRSVSASCQCQTHTQGDDRSGAEALECGACPSAGSLGFRRQVPIAGYIVDFACPDERLIVELDGTSQAAMTPSAMAPPERHDRKPMAGRMWF